MRRVAWFFVLVVVTLLIGGGVCCVLMLKRGFSAREEPTSIEKGFARAMRHLAVTRQSRNATNPVPLTPDILTEGRHHFADHCALCHGNDGRGRTEIGRNLYPKAPDMTTSATQSLSDGEIFSIIKNGVRLTGMPAWGEDTAEDDAESWKLVHFIRHLPELTDEELKEMRELNPRSPEEFREEEEERKFLEEGTVQKDAPTEHHH